MMEKLRSEVEEVSVIDSLKAQVEQNPTDIKGHLRLGWTYYGEGMLDEAVEAFGNAKDRFPEDIEVLYALALTYKKAGREKESLDIFRNVVKSAENLDDQTRGVMLRRLAIGHVNVLERGDWDLREETWERK
jgi:cytochrome c-type biogenesis protein CcmH/NrfG